MPESSSRVSFQNVGHWASLLRGQARYALEYSPTLRPFRGRPGFHSFFSRWCFNFMTKTKAKTKEILVSTCSSCEVEVPPAKARWCPTSFVSRFVATTLKYHRLKPGGVREKLRKENH